MQFYEKYRKNYNDLLISVEKFDGLTYEEINSLRSVNSDRVIKNQLKKFEITFEMLIEQMRFFLERKNVNVPIATASIIDTFYKKTLLFNTTYEELITINYSYKKLRMAYDTKNKNFTSSLYKRLDNYYTTMLLTLAYLDCDDAELFQEEEEPDKPCYSYKN